MSKKEDEPVEEPQVENDEGEESDEYEVEEEEEHETGGFEEDDEGEGDEEASLTKKGETLTALLLGGGAPQGEQEADGEEEDVEDDDEAYTPAPEITGPATAPIAAQPPLAIGRKRSRDDEDANEGNEDLSGDYGAEENSEAVTKKARAAADNE